VGTLYEYHLLVLTAFVIVTLLVVAPIFKRTL